MKKYTLIAALLLSVTVVAQPAAERPLPPQSGAAQSAAENPLPPRPEAEQPKSAGAEALVPPAPPAAPAHPGAPEPPAPPAAPAHPDGPEPPAPPAAPAHPGAPEPPAPPAAPAHPDGPEPPAPPLLREGDAYRLSRVIPVEGRQGVAADSNYYYVSGSTALYKYTKQGELVAVNERPFEGLPLPANHIGDIDVWRGEIYAGIETFCDGVGEHIQIAVYDAATLRWKRSIAWEPSSGQVEVCGLAVDRDNARVWMADWVDGRYLYEYDLKTGAYLRRVHLRPVPQWQQGIFMLGGRMLLSADDGDADLDEADNLYVADLRGATTCATVLPFREMGDFRRAGEIEGLTIDPATGELVVLSNRGSRIVLGMVRGFYPGYDREVHELYIYERVR